MTAFDFLIVGAGSAGCVLAARLSEDREVKVALIEAGGPADDPAIADPLQWPLLQGTAIDWQFATTPQAGTADRVHAWPRGKVLGGSSCLNAMAHVRGHPSDFDAWVEDGCPGWGYLDLLPYFIRSETSDRGASAYHGDAGPIRLATVTDPHPITRSYLAAGEACGFAPTDEHNGADMTGPTLNTLTLVDGRRQTVADAYLTPALERPNLTLMPETSVRRLIVDKAGACRSLDVTSLDGSATTLTAERGVILSAGAIGSPALLLASGIGPADELTALGIDVVADLPAVGRNLHDHLLAGGNVYRARRPVPPSKYQHSESLMYAARVEGSAPELVLACVVVPVTTEMFAPVPLGEAYTIMFGFTQPRSRGSVRLTAAGPNGAPRIDPNYLAESYDRDVYLDALALAREVGHAEPLNDWRAEELLPGATLENDDAGLAFLQKAAYTHHHPVGTCRMGQGDDAVVTPDLGVRGIDGLYVIDASVMPRITSGPVNAAIIAIAERASDLLRGRTPMGPADPPTT